MEFRLLGPIEVLESGNELPIGGGRQRALLVALLIRPNEVVSADRLIDELWGEHPPANPDNALQALVSRLRRALGDGRLEHRAGGYVLHVEPGERDLDRFVEMRARGQPHGALSLWRGPPLADVEFDDFARHEIARLEELRLATLEERIDADLAAGRHRELGSELERLVAEHPLREHLRAQLMLALYRSGRQAHALAAYSEGRRHLVEELGIEPGEELRSLERAILKQDRSLRVARTRRRRLAGGVTAVAVALAATALLAGSSRSDSVAVGSQEVGVLDVATGRVLASVPLGFKPITMARSPTGIWVGGDHGQLVRIDPERARIAASYAVGDFSIKGLAADESEVWFAELDARETTIFRLSPESGKVEPQYRIDDRGPLDRSAPEPLALTGRTLWASNAVTRLTRIDLRRHRMLGVVPDNGSGWVWASAKTVWSLSAQTDTLTRIDPRTGRTVNVVTLAQNAAGPQSVHFAIKLEVGEGSVWVVEYRSQSIGRVDEPTNAIVAQIKLGHPVNAVAVAPGAVWAASGDGTLQRIDPATNRVVQTLALGGSPQALALAHRRLFVLVS